MELELIKVLSISFLFPTLVSLLFVYFVYSRVLAWHRLRHIDGPWIGSFSYLFMSWVTFSGKQSYNYRKLNKKYGPLVRIGPNDLITDDPEIIRRMNGARSKYQRSSWYNAMRMDPYLPSLFSIMDTDVHDKLKAQLSFGYGGKENPTIEADIDEQLASLVALIRRKYLSDDHHLRPIDFAERIQYFTLDAITKIAYGRAFGYLATDTDVYGYIETAETQVPMLVALADVPWLTRLFFSETMLKLVGPKPTDKKGIGKMMAVAQEVAGERFGPDAKDHQDMLGSFVRHGVSRRRCESEMLFQIIAGSDTTATALRGTMLSLLTSPLAYFKLREEIDTAIAEGRISSPITLDEAKGLDYLQAVIYEGLRINIPFSGLTMKRVPPEGDTLNGKFVPGGTRIAHSFLSLQRSTAIYGKDVDLFRPERWLNIDPEKRREMTNATELLFGYGRFGCSGKNVAFMEMNKVYVELLRSFDFQLVDPHNPIKTMNKSMFFQKHMWVKIVERTWRV
ncbi:cytochrome P450 [Annulohypoxylon maeteangense]|uniref:cytochrome P450 n=1 Tax=Annulohypoxylon maeteangense TaxID=1927788 RepID=UPI00200869EE|nr:cytochrome P450 [Annulohypoxylon maeteangense]KAI0885617.1 cytochrome P450 [Annulohypoxylon maeteangense]